MENAAHSSQLRSPIFQMLGYDFDADMLLQDAMRALKEIIDNECI